MKHLFIALATIISASASFATDIGATAPTTNQIVVHSATSRPYYERDVFQLTGVDGKKVGSLNCFENFLIVLDHNYAFDNRGECHEAMTLLENSLPQHNVVFTVQDDGHSTFRVVSVKPQ